MGPAQRVTGLRPAFYAARPGGWRDWWTLLHPPYTGWHLAYVSIGAALAPHLQGVRLGASVLAFLLAVGVAAHALDELHGRPLATGLSERTLATAAVLATTAAVGLGVAGVLVVGPALVPFIATGPVLLVAYNAELFGGILHNDAGFSAGWGAFPVLTGYVAQAGRLGWPVLPAAGGAIALSLAQRSLSAQARELRRRVVRVEGSMERTDGSRLPLDRRALLAPLERALGAMSWGVMALAAGLVVARLVG